MITATDVATVHVGVYRKRRLVPETAGQVQPTENMMRLPRRLGSGVYDLRVLATTADGRTATTRLPLLGRATVYDRLRNTTAHHANSQTPSPARDRGPSRGCSAAAGARSAAAAPARVSFGRRGRAWY